MKTIPLTIALALGAFASMHSPTYAQGYWTPGWVPCRQDGTPVSSGGPWEAMSGPVWTTTTLGNPIKPVTGPTSTSSVSKDAQGAQISAQAAGETGYQTAGGSFYVTNVFGTESVFVNAQLRGFFKWSPVWTGSGIPTPKPGPPTEIGYRIVQSLSSNSGVTTPGGIMASSVMSTPGSGRKVSTSCYAGSLYVTKTDGYPWLVHGTVRSDGVGEVYLKGFGYAYAAGDPYNTHGYGSSSTSFGANTEVDNRWVAIASDIDQSYADPRKGPDDPPSTKHVADTRNADLSTTVDSAVSSDVEQDGGNVRLTGTVNLNAQTHGISNPQYSWSSGPQDDDNSLYGVPLTHQQHQAQMSIIVPQPLGEALGQYTKFKMDVTDPSDNVVATTTYKVRWHMPYEHYVKDPHYKKNPVEFYDYVAAAKEPEGPIPKNGFYQSTIEYHQIDASDWLKAGILTYEAVEPATEKLTENPYYLCFFAALKLGADQLQEKLKKEQAQVTWSHTQVFEDGLQKGQPGCTYEPMPKYIGPDAAGIKHWIPDRGKYLMENPGFMRRQRITYLVGEAYGKNGYIGPAAEHEVEEDGSGYPVADFKLGTWTKGPG